MNLFFNLLKASGVSEAVETFLLNLSNPTNATILDGQGICTILRGPVIFPSFSVSRSSGVAPLSVHFDASATTSDVTSLPFHELHYAWSFGDIDGGSTWSYGTRPGVSSKNEAYGPVSAHCFNNSGAFTVTLWCYYLTSGGQLIVNSTTQVITVTAADTYYSGTNTIAVANGTLPVAGVGGVPAGASCQNLSSWTSIVALITTGKRVLLKADDSWTASSAATIAGTVSGATLGKYGSGADPVINCSSEIAIVSTSIGASDIRFLNLNFIGAIDAYTVARSAIKPTSSTHILVKGVELSHMGVGINPTLCTGIMVVDCYLHDVGNGTIGPIAIYAENNINAAMMGCRLSTLTQNHSVRWQGVRKGVFSYNSSDNGRATGHVITVRGWVDAVKLVWDGFWCEDIIISDNSLDSGDTAEPIKVGPQDAVSAERVRNVIVERNYVKTVDRGCIKAACAENQTIRNNIFVVTNYYYALLVEGGSTAEGVSPAPSSTYIYNNTMYMPTSGGWTSGFSGVYIAGQSPNAWNTPLGNVIKNNLIYAPGQTKNGNSSGSLPSAFVTYNVTSVDVTESNNSTDTQIANTRPWTAALPATLAEYVPVGYAVNAGTFVPVRQDFFNVDITGVRELGAIQA